MSHNLTPDSAEAAAPVLTPMQVCEKLIGPPEVMGPAIGYGNKAAYHWRRERDGRRPGDLPSAEVMRLLLAHSAAKHLGLTAEHLIWGATEAEIADILALRELAEGARAIEAQPAFASRRTRAA
jgi:hypothetical protein